MKRFFLSINDSRTDSGVTLFDSDKNIIFSISEERITRIKCQGGFPFNSMNYLVENYKLELDKIKKIYFCGILTPPFVSRIFSNISKINVVNQKGLRRYFYDFFDYKLKIFKKRPNSFFGKLQFLLVSYFIKKKLPEFLRKKPIEFIEHHDCHINSAYRFSGFDNALVASFDGYGDGLSAKIVLVRDNNKKLIYTINASNSLGEFYALITEYLGFTPHKHEGKITGLAAYGDSKKVKIRFPFVLNKKLQLKYKWNYGIFGLKILKKLLEKHSREDISAWLQDNIEKIVCKIIDELMIKYEISNLCLSGGLFANVKLNQKLHELKSVKNIFIYPAMGDQGLSTGVFFMKDKKPFNNVFYGPSYSNADIKKELIKNNLNYKFYKNIEKKIANELYLGKIVARFDGRMEFGPRALGNRSILVSAGDKKINDILNNMLKRTEFMPFAPVILDDYVNLYIKNLKGAELTSKFMNISFKVTNKMLNECPAAVHVDKTARPQIIIRKDNLSYYKILIEYYKLSKISVLINTSFNMHEEPIVMTPSDAIRGFLSSGIDCLAIGNYLVSKS